MDISPIAAWEELLSGNERFVAGAARHMGQDAHRRAELTGGQHPMATIFGCSDSRVGAEILFDCGLGDLFVVRTAGQVADSGALGSLEYAVEHLGVPLIVVLGHSSCGAIAASYTAAAEGNIPGGFVRDVVEHILPNVVVATAKGAQTPDEVLPVHVRATVDLLIERSQVVRNAVRASILAVIGATYNLADGSVNGVYSVGPVHLPGVPQVAGADPFVRTHDGVLA